MSNFQVDSSVQFSELVYIFCFPSRTEAEINNGSEKIMGYEQTNYFYKAAITNFCFECSGIRESYGSDVFALPF
jgi:hypothetical protein